MTRAISIFLVAVLLPAGIVQAGATDAVVRKPSVDVYAAPYLDAGTISVLKQNTAVQISAQSGLWYEVSLADGKKGFVRVNDVRVDYADTEKGSANLDVLTGGTAGAGRVTETAGVRGIDVSDLQAATSNPAQFDAMVDYRRDAAAAAAYASEHGWQATQVAFSAEATSTGGNGAAALDSAAGAADAAQAAGGKIAMFGEKLGSLLGGAKKVVPKPEQEQLAQELALGPQIAGRVLGARPLWGDANAQQHVNVVGRWVASQTSRPDLPWTFGVIDTPEVNAFAAPGGYVLVTRGLYEILSSDSELAAVLGHEIGHCVQRDHYNVIRKQELATLGTETLSGEIETGSSPAEMFARSYVEKNGAAILLTTLDREAEFRADEAAEIYLARSGMNPMALYAVLQKMTALGSQSTQLTALYKTHPPLDARMDNIDERGYAGLEAYTTRE